MSNLRKLRRSIAHASMARAGFRRVNKWFFSRHWREYDQPTVDIQRRAAAHLREIKTKKAAHLRKLAKKKALRTN
jgi:hypothetical protein